MKRNLDTISSQCFLKSLKRKKEKRKIKAKKKLKRKEKQRRKKEKVKERDYFSNCFTCYLLCCSVSQFISYLLPPSGLYFLWWILQKQLLKFFLNQHGEKKKYIFPSRGLSCQKMSIYIHVTELLSALNTICFYSHVCYHSYKMEEFPITCSSTVHSWLKVSGLVSSQSRPLIICSNTVYKMEYVFRKSTVRITWF